MAFGIGNQEAKKADRTRARAFEAELKMALAAVDATDRNGLRRIVDALIRKAEAEDVAAIREIADRIDGKVPSPVEHDVSGKIIIELNDHWAKT